MQGLLVQHTHTTMMTRWQRLMICNPFLSTQRRTNDVHSRDYIPIAYRLHTVDLAVAFETDHFWFQQLCLQSCLEISTELTQHINLFCTQLYTPSQSMFPSLVAVTLNWKINWSCKINPCSLFTVEMWKKKQLCNYKYLMPSDIFHI
jgi:hypothetical protein